MARDPILWFAEIPLFESELDDNGVSQASAELHHLISSALGQMHTVALTSISHGL